MNAPFPLSLARLRRKVSMLFGRARWILLAFTAALAACSGDSRSTAGNTELKVIVPNNESAPGVPAPIDIQTVEYTINCLGNSDTFLDNNASFPDEVVINGNLEVVDGRTSGSPPVPTEIWQGFMDLPPGPCTVQLRARDGDGEVICTATEPFNIAADTTTKVNMVLICDVSYQAPVGMLDVDATFSFNVGNFCPDLFVLNCYDTNPLPEDIGFGPLLVARTGCELRFRDGDNQCGASCDPQTCAVTPDGLTCSPGPDPGVSTTITCTSNPLPGENETARMNCSESPFLLDTECTINGDHLGLPPEFLDGVIPCASDADCFASTGISDGVCDPVTNLCDFAITDYNWSFFALCLPPEVGGTPGAIVTCTAVTTDGDVDCDKTKVATFTCPGLPPCETLGGGAGTCDETDCPACDDGNDCTANTCSGAAVCGNAPLATGTACTSAVAPAFCDGAGVCVSSNCTTLPDPDAVCSDGNDCTVNTCNVAGLCETAPVATGTSCAGGTGTCDALSACIDNCSALDCDDGNDCTVDVCDPSTNPGTCSNPPEPLGTSCAGGALTCDGVGNCFDGIFSFPASSVAIDMCCNNNALPQQSIIPIQLDIGPIAGNMFGLFPATLSGLLTFPVSFMDVAQTVVVGGVQVADLIDAQVTVLPRSGATGAPVTLSAVYPPGACLIGGGACDVSNNQPLPAGGNSDCAPVGSFNPCQRLVSVPIDTVEANCIALDVAEGRIAGSTCTVGTDCTKQDQWTLNGFCVTGPLPIPLDPQVANFTAGTPGSFGQTMLFGFDDLNTSATIVGGVVTIGAPVFANPTGPNGLKVNASGLAVAIECVMAVETGDTLTDPVTCGTTPDNLLLGSGVGGTALYLLPY